MKINIKKLKIWVVVGFVVIITLLVRWFLNNEFDSVASLQQYLEKYGVFAPIMLGLFQMCQVVVPVLPGYLGCAVGSIAFGPFVGFWCNYIGITAGSIIAYFIARRFGKDLVIEMFSQKTYDKWSKKIENSKSYDVFLFVATLLPLFPDDFFCYFSGIVRQNAKKFIWIIILGKPWCILAYSLGFGLIK